MSSGSLHAVVNFLAGQTPAPYAHAKRELGDNFISPMEVGLQNYTVLQLMSLHDSFPSPEMVEWCKQNGAIVAPTAPDKNDQVRWMIITISQDIEGLQLLPLPATGTNWCRQLLKKIRNVTFSSTHVALVA